MELKSILKCPDCGYEATEFMPIDACVWSYNCKGCGHRLKAKPGDGCVFLLLRVGRLPTDANGERITTTNSFIADLPCFRFEGT